MGLIKCRDVALEVLDEASSQFGALWRVNEEAKNLIVAVCDDIDVLSREFGGIAFEVEVDDTTTDIRLSLICDDIVIEDKNHKLYSVVGRAKRFIITNLDSESMRVDFIFPGIWECVF